MARRSWLRLPSSTSGGLFRRSQDGAPSILTAGGLVQLFSIATILATNLVLPIVMGSTRYGVYVTILACSYISLALISVPADTVFLLRAPGERVAITADEAAFMPAKSLLTAVLAAVAAGLASLTAPALLAAVLLAGGQAALTGTLHQSYRGGAARHAVKTAMITSFPLGVLPLALGWRVSPATLGLLSGGVSVVLALLVQRSHAVPWSVRDLRTGVRQVSLSLGRQAWPSYMNSAVPWLALLRLGAVRPASTATLKILFSLMNAGQTLIPLSSSAVVAATIDDEDRQRASVIRRLWWVTCAFAVALSVGLLAATAVIERIYAADYPALGDLLPLAAAGLLGCTIYWIFWPVGRDRARRSESDRWLVAIMVATVLAILLAGTSTRTALAIYGAGITASAVCVTLRIASRRSGSAVLVLPIVIAAVGSYAMSRW